MKDTLSNYTHVYFLGIGGIGMSAIARYFRAYGMQVAGYDRTSTPLTDELREEGIRIHFIDDVKEIPTEFTSDKSKTLVVLTPAVPQDHTELRYFTDQGFNVMKRSQVLGLITSGERTFAIAGTHGKTTTSSILAHILYSCNVNVTAFLGGITVNYDSNFLRGEPNAVNHVIVVEADEFDRSFLTLHPEKAVITSMDPDHLDVYGHEEEMRSTYHLFASQVKKLLVLNHRLEKPATSAEIVTYGNDTHSSYHAKQISVVDGRYKFDLVTPGYILKGLTMGLPGRHNVENAVAACAIALESGIDPSALSDALTSYRGVRRRFEICVNTSDTVYVDDYAHHPEELKAAILSAREMYPTKKITGVFQPHLFSRTRDFADGFAESLDLLDKVYLLEIYPARELPIPGVDSKMILDKMKVEDKVLVSPEELIRQIRLNRPEVLMTLGAGDIDRLVAPLTRLLTTA